MKAVIGLTTYSLGQSARLKTVIHAFIIAFGLCRLCQRKLCVRVTQQIASVMSKSVVYPITNIMSGAMKMNAVGIDVSKGKSTVAILRPQGIVVASLQHKNRLLKSTSICHPCAFTR